MNSLARKGATFFPFRSVLPLIVILLGVGCSRTEKGYFDNGELQFEVEKKDGRYHGKATFYYDNGVKQHECYYSNDTLQGKSTRWYNNGKVYAVEHYRNNHLHGKAQYFDMNGKKLKEQNYHLDTLHGESLEYYTSGQTRIQGAYQKGLFDGKWLYFDDDGTVVGMGEYKRGTGKQKAWYRNSTLKREVNYLENEKHGRETLYNADGTVSKVLVYDRGTLVSTEEF